MPNPVSRKNISKCHLLKIFLSMQNIEILKINTVLAKHWIALWQYNTQKLFFFFSYFFMNENIM